MCNPDKLMDKAVAVIQSCKTPAQYEVAKVYAKRAVLAIHRHPDAITTTEYARILGTSLATTKARLRLAYPSSQV